MIFNIRSIQQNEIIIGDVKNNHVLNINIGNTSHLIAQNDNNLSYYNKGIAKAFRIRQQQKILIADNIKYMVLQEHDTLLVITLDHHHFTINDLKNKQTIDTKTKGFTYNW